MGWEYTLLLSAEMGRERARPRESSHMYCQRTQIGRERARISPFGQEAQAGNPTPGPLYGPLSGANAPDGGPKASMHPSEKGTS